MTVQWAFWQEGPRFNVRLVDGKDVIPPNAVRAFIPIEIPVRAGADEAWFRANATSIIEPT